MDLEKFRFSPIIKVNIFTFLFIGRFIKDKGVLELIEACRKMKKRQVNFQVIFIAPLDKENPTSLHHDISLKDLDKLGIEYIPYVSDVRAYIRKSHCVVLPSYGEGMPLSLLEGMAIGRPIITTNVPGCKDLVNNNGLLVSVKSTEFLYEAMLAMTGKDLVSLQNMGLNGRKFVEKKYSIFYVLNKYQELIDNIKDKRKE
ncbi:glycosyltransferase [Rickettsiella massiliensis]|uniref:glycosyltransferase n=1 Tax=Rickettsiella massiliensis TaxID=676517 RepID=UPI002286D9FC|nr:glycosyltransferase [Rickettsiella massiliensis]